MSIREVSCQTIIKKTIDLNSIGKIGIVRSEYDTISSGLFKDYYKVFENSFSKNLIASGVDSVGYLKDVFNFDTIERHMISQLCEDKNLDGLLITKIYFLSRAFIYKNFLNRNDLEGRSMFSGDADIYISIKIFDRTGNLTILTSHKVQTGNLSSGPGGTINRGITKSIDKINKTNTY